MNLNGVEYYYIRNVQSDIIGLFDKTGTQIVSYTYDTWGKLISTTGSLASTVGVKNPYLYRGYRYDTETGLYYLQSRYYNPEWGRFINADGIIGQTGQLLGHNLFAYCGNNPINNQDKSGFLYGGSLFNGVLGGAGGIGNVLGNFRPVLSGSSGSSGGGFNYQASIQKGVKSGSLDVMIARDIGSQIKPKKVWKDIGTLGLGKYVDEFSAGAKGGKKALGVAGTVGFTLWDAGSSALKGEYVGAGIDIAAGATSAGTGILIGIGVAAAVTAGAPALLIAAIGYGVGFFAGVAIDKYATRKKDEYYGR
jgi:RHS repeat-associated protein